MQSVMTHLAPAAIGPYSQAILKNNTLFISGQMGIDPNSGVMPEGFEAQTNMVFSNIKAILQAANMGTSHVVKVTVFLKDMNDFAQLNEIYSRNFSTPYPAREAIQVARLPKDALIEISVIAMR
ncbi:MAG: RidA family protein [Candidatus Cloacimonetes bacterium]|nr:RidA family protein [Candidatus Cloacimonadota bacterium]